MDLKAELLRAHNKEHTLQIVDYIGDDEEKFAVLMKLFMASHYRTSQRAAWPMGICAKRHPHLIQPYLKKLIINLDKDIHDAVKRNTVRALQFIKIPDKLLGMAAENCFNLLTSRKEAIAIKVFSMTVLANICKEEPELKQELKVAIEDQLPFASAGFKSRAKKVFKQLNL